MELKKGQLAIAKDGYHKFKYGEPLMLVEDTDGIAGLYKFSNGEQVQVLRQNEFILLIIHYSN